MMKKLIMMLVLGAWVAASQATLYFYEGFDYAADTKLISSTTNWLNIGTPAQTNRSGSLSYAGLPVGTGGKEQLFGSTTPNNYGTAKRTLWGGTSGVADPGTTNLFASFLFNVASIGSPVAGGSSSASYVFNLRNGYYTTGGQGEVVVTNSGAGFKIGLKQYDKTLVAWDPTVYALDTTLLVIVSYTNGAGTNWTSQLWVNPALSPTMGTANATIAQAWYNSTNTAHVQIGAGNTANASGSVMYFDELRVGSTWGDVVVSEPARSSGLMFSVVSAGALGGAATYTLTVNSGTGDGSYTNGAQVSIVADAPANGMLFDQWTGDTQFVNNVAYTNALVSMPTNAVTLTATYAATGYVSYSTAPYQQNMSSTGIVIMCEMPQDIPLHLEYGQTAAYGQTVPFVSEPNAGGTWFYRALVTGLEPAQTYHYRLVQNSGASADDTFAASPTNSVDFSFGVWSDGHGENYGWTLDPTEPVRSFLKQMVGAGVAFALSVGDMVGQGTNYSHVRTSYLDCVARELGPHVPWYIAWGNHDSILTNAALRRAADLPSRNRPGFSSGHGSYTFTYANCFFVCIDEFQRSTINNGWLQQELSSAAAQQARFRIVAVHYPPYSERWLDGNAALRSDLVPLMEQYDVDLCISGHVHEYERGETNGVKYVITGASCNLDTKEVIVKDWPHMTVGGAQTIAGYRRTQSSSGVLGPEIPIVGGLVNEYSFIQVIGDVLKFECRAFNSDGSYIGVLDSFELQARPQP